MSIDVSAVETYTKWSVQETLAFYGSDIPFNYSINGVTHSSTFHALPYNSITNKITGLNIEQNSVINGASGSMYDIIMYCTNDFIATPSDSIDIDIPIDLYYTGGFRSFVGCMVGFNNVTSSDNLITNHPDNVFGLQRALSANSSADSSLSNYYNLGTFQFAKTATTDTPYSNTPCRLLTFDDVDGAVASIRFQGARTFGADYYLYLIVATPFSYGDVSHDSPITTGPPVTTAPSGTGDINVNVDVDLTETNGLLGSILDALSSLGSSIVNGIKNIFLPDQEDIVNWKQTIVNILNETFGGIPELEEQLKNAISSIFSATARETVRFEGIKVPAAAGEPEAVIVPAQDVPLKPSGFGDLFSWAETFINIVATIAVANTCFNQIKRIVVGEVVVDAD